MVCSFQFWFVCAHAMLGLTKRSKTTILIGMLLHVLHPCSQEVKEDREGRVERLLNRGVKECRVIRPGEYHDSEQIHITDDQHSPYTQFSKSDMREIERIVGRRLANRPLSSLF